MKWIIQTNMGNSDSLIDACASVGVDYKPITVIPFSSDIPKVKGGDVIFYGAVNFINSVWEFNRQAKRWTPGVLFSDNFDFKKWRDRYKEECLNFAAEITTLGELEKRGYDDESLLFIRPTDDLKAFAGQVIQWKDYKAWLTEIDYGIPEFKKTEILVGEPFGIKTEWRLFVVDGKVSSGSKYRTYHRLDQDSFVPSGVIKYAERIAQIWTPAPIFSLDIAECGDKYYVNEIGCFHSSGFYYSDIEQIVCDVTNYLRA